MKTNRLAVVSLLADMGNGEVRDAPRDLPKINGRDFPLSTPRQILHWDAEWHFDPARRDLRSESHRRASHPTWVCSTASAHFPNTPTRSSSAPKQQKAVVGFAHMQYLKNDIPQDLDCCAPLEYPVETALGSIDFLMEDVNGAESAIQAYYRLLNCGFRPGLAAATDFPCNCHQPIGTQLTYVRTADGSLSYRGWIDGIAAGRTVVSRNAHREFLDLKVNGKARLLGMKFRSSAKGPVEVDVRWSAAAPLQRKNRTGAQRRGSGQPRCVAAPNARVDLHARVAIQRERLDRRAAHGRKRSPVAHGRRLRYRKPRTGARQLAPMRISSFASSTT